MSRPYAPKEVSAREAAAPLMKRRRLMLKSWLAMISISLNAKMRKSADRTQRKNTGGTLTWRRVPPVPGRSREGIVCYVGFAITRNAAEMLVDLQRLAVRQLRNTRMWFTLIPERHGDNVRLLREVSALSPSQILNGHLQVLFKSDGVLDMPAI